MQSLMPAKKATTPKKHTSNKAVTPATPAIKPIGGTNKQYNPHNVTREIGSRKPANKASTKTAQELGALLAFRRPHNSETEKVFCSMLLGKINTLLYPADAPKNDSDPQPLVDGFGNIHLDLRGTKNKSETLFSCHVDTVHNKDGTQSVLYDNIRNELFIDEEDSSCLGADDGVGVFIMLHMIDRRVPGYYIFHRGEEVGGLGSNWILKNKPDLLKQFKRAVAFDRKGTNDVINYQRGVCASNEFCKALAKALNDSTPSFLYAPARGVYTDTANYTSIIPECSNISVGYYAQHSKNEHVDLQHLLLLLNAVVKIDWETLPTHRDPAAVTTHHTTGYQHNSNTYYKPKATAKQKTDIITKLEIRYLIARHPDIVADLLADLELEWADVDELLMNHYADRMFETAMDMEDEDVLNPDDPDYNFGDPLFPYIGGA